MPPVQYYIIHFMEILDFIITPITSIINLSKERGVCTHAFNPLTPGAEYIRGFFFFFTTTLSTTF